MKMFYPGVYDISIDEYHEAGGLSRSGLMLFKKSPLHYADYYREKNKSPKQDSPALQLGNLVHAYILEPKLFTERYFVSDKPPQTSKIGKAVWEEIQKRANGKTVISTETFNYVEKMGQSFLTNDLAAEFLKGARIEQSIFWKDSKTNTLLKSRPDIWLPNMLGDVKTAADASPRAFQRDIINYGYHIQAAMMQDGIYHIEKKKITEYVCLVVEKSPPYAIAIYMLDQTAIERGREEYKALIEEYSEYESKQVWPGYKPTVISLPAYY